ncbi:hypothetical protein GCM10027026_44130 [Myroides odoratimimus subsp. xuanwuensis]
MIGSGFVLAGLALAAYPALRPYGPETGAEGAADLASTAWLTSHALGMIGFMLIAFALRGAVQSHPWAWGGRPLREAESRAWLAAVLLLPYYGAEAYGLGALGRHALDTGDPAVLEVADSFRYAPFEMATLLLGLGALALVGGKLATGLWAAGTTARWGGLLAGLGLATYLPQFFVAPAGRILHGAVLGAGLVLIGAAAMRGERRLDEAGSPRSGDAVHAEPAAVRRA